MKSILYSALLGLGALIALHLLAPFTGIEMGVTRLSIGVSAVLGVPGVTLMVIIGML